MNNSALVIVDMLYDFIDGSLACHNAENAVKETLDYIDVQTKGQNGEDHEILDTYPILFIRDCHPADHSSFIENGGTWPVHCVRGTRGGEIHDLLKPYVKEELTFDKGCASDTEQYSGYDGRNGAGQSLGEILELLDCTDVYVCGIATEFCVMNTCLDLMKAGLNVHLLQKCVAYVDKDGHDKAISEMKHMGISIE
ncbi:MAG: isochorismatase family protein [Bacteroidales bacterium]|nr:isochorismatase family protein [Bacteroidales bacterium]